MTAWIPVPILVPGEKTSTRVEPAKSLYALVSEVAQRAGVIDAGIWIGYAWADEPRNHAAVVVTGDDRTAVAESAELLASSLWRVRDDFAFAAPTGTLKHCLDAAIQSAARPFFISDSGDNPTAGGAGDATGTLRELLRRPEIMDAAVEVVYASIPDRAAVDTCVAAGVGGEVSLRAGAIVDDTVAPPAEITGTVERIVPDIAADWLMALTPGGVDQDLSRLPHHRIIRPMVPFDEVTATPDLSVRILGSVR